MNTITVLCVYKFSIVRVIKQRRMRLVGHVALTGEGRGVYRVLVGKRDHWGDGRIILRWIFKKWDVGYGLDWAGSG
jgi:hypothetical protein